MLEAALAVLEEDFELNDSSDKMQATIAAYYFVKWQQAVKNDTIEMQAHYETLLRRNLTSLKATRDKREGVDITIHSPAQWASEMIDLLKQTEAADSIVEESHSIAKKTMPCANSAQSEEARSANLTSLAEGENTRSEEES